MRQPGLRETIRTVQHRRRRGLPRWAVAAPFKRQCLKDSFVPFGSARRVVEFDLLAKNGLYAVFDAPHYVRTIAAAERRRQSSGKR